MPVDLSVLPAFVGVILMFLAPPGPDMAYMVAVGLERGRAAAVRAILGIGTGMAIYAAAVVAGLGTVVREYPLALDVVKAAGAAYLLWLAWSTFRSPGDELAGGTTATARTPATGAYRQGALISLTNPKVMLFFLAVLPQFLGSATSTRLQLAMLGGVNVLTEVVLYGAIGLMAGTFHRRFTASGRSGATLHRISAAVYAALACLVIADLLGYSLL